MVHRILKVAAVVGICLLSDSLTQTAWSQADDEKLVKEPVFRISRSNEKESTAESIIPTSKPHPLDPAIVLAKDRLAAIRADIVDYTAIMVKRERINGTLGDPEFMKIKIRNPRQSSAGNIPFSVYMRFLKPKKIRGREVIYVDGQNNGKLVAHETGFAGLTRAYLDPTGWLAMKNSRYPIYDSGIEKLVEKLIEKAERDKQVGDCEVEFIKNAKINGRVCTRIKVVHPEHREPFDFHIAEVYIDDEMQIPMRYAAYDWPTQKGGKPVLLEEYTYLNIETNVGLTDKDFDPDNPEYEYP